MLGCDKALLWDLGKMFFILFPELCEQSIVLLYGAGSV